MILNLSRYHREHEKFYSQAPVQRAIGLQQASGVLKTLADRWSQADPRDSKAGNPKTIAQALSMVRPTVKAILIGIHPGPAEFNPTEVVRGAKSIFGSYAYAPEIWNRALALLSSGRISVEPMITHRIPISEAKEGF